MVPLWALGLRCSVHNRSLQRQMLNDGRAETEIQTQPVMGAAESSPHLILALTSALRVPSRIEKKRYGIGLRVYFMRMT
ncbi:hypothetical protein NDU88_006975 [Pleurodeles waltl]|uniref:Uncharacterized protein n=1 Tax=Pleurodeles waltl TaxID=8319 RepID=A0AAV7WFR0_PLEWA|nr:hypothetical protein NDU88_006975 [Pleurodeles waltl]